MPSREIEEILEIIWMEREKGESDLCIVQADIKNQNLPDVVEEMKKEGFIKIEEKKILLTPEGEKAASGLIRRHRLAERLLIDVLETAREELEDSACKFEHILSEEVTDAICILLGHPRECPHGLSIPEGRCCKKAKETIESLVLPLDRIEVGEVAVVAYILTRNHPRLHKLMSFGIGPGVRVKMHQKFPSYIIQVEETQVALEKEVVEDIYVRRPGKQ